MGLCVNEVPMFNEADAGTIGGDAIDHGVLVADHPINMHARCVRPTLFVAAAIGVGCLAIGVCLSKCDMAGGVFVEECFEEDDAGIGDRGFVGDECNFANAAGAFVAIKELEEGVFVGIGKGFYHLAVLEADTDTFNDLIGVV